jgi:chromosome segregation ATPase
MKKRMRKKAAKRKTLRQLEKEIFLLARENKSNLERCEKDLTKLHKVNKDLALVIRAQEAEKALLKEENQSLCATISEQKDYIEHVENEREKMRIKMLEAASNATKYNGLPTFVKRLAGNL